LAAAHLIRSQWTDAVISAAVIIHLENLPGAAALNANNINWTSLINTNE
jgi:hypothetical protein